jgi:hypothetical protein
MNGMGPLTRYCGSLVAAVACAAVLALRPPQQQEMTGHPAPAAGYLDCARITSESLREPDLVTLCSVVADALLQRGFGTEVERQLQWWKTPQDAPRAGQAAPAPAPAPAVGQAAR